MTNDEVKCYYGLCKTKLDKQKNKKELKCTLQQMAEPKYKEFSRKIVKGKLKMLGIRIPVLRKIAKEIVKGNFKRIYKNLYSCIS